MSFIKRHIVLVSTLLGAILGYAFLHPFGMIVHSVFHPHEEGFLHIHWNEILIIFAKAFSLSHWPQSLSYIVLTSAIGYLFGSLLKINRKVSEQAKTFSAIGLHAAGIVHDLKNPLGIIMACVDYMKNKSKDDNFVESYEMIHRQIKRLSGMITNIKIAAQSAGVIQLAKDWINLKLFLQGIVSDMALKHEIHLNLNYDKDILIDRRYFERIIWNLINNADEALEGTREGRIEILAKEANGFIEISISDNGRGIPKEVLKQLFEVGKTYGKDKGSGLGLYTCKKIIDAHRGKIWINSEVDQGATVFINIPK